MEFNAFLRSRSERLTMQRLFAQPEYFLPYLFIFRKELDLFLAHRINVGRAGFFNGVHLRMHWQAATDGVDF